jgi:hypothetical protein
VPYNLRLLSFHSSHVSVGSFNGRFSAFELEEMRDGTAEDNFELEGLLFDGRAQSMGLILEVEAESRLEDVSTATMWCPFTLPANQDN